MFASIPYDIFVRGREGYYHTVIYLLLRLSGIPVRAEAETNIGRVDAAAETGTHIYIMEFKLGTSEEALAQIKEKRYHEPFLNSEKSIVLVGIGIDPATRSITDPSVETLRK
ncbi:MAG: PD-(D/E)XK nuclease domain-containing protein [Candidatus Aminicenantes bacterium]|nr:PD-(D/E)XK nuclease domain-containing protein [Candidatus Aminicenantes bacterium]